MHHSPDINIHSGIAQLMNTSTATTTQQILFIDSHVQDLDELLAGVQPNTAVYVLHPQENGIAQITTILQQHSAIETVYLVAHGKPGCLYLGNTIFNQETLPTVSELLKNWNIGKLLIYACNVANGETGETFLHSLHHYTKAKIAASSNPIGQTEFGQNWQLNKTTHPIEIKSVFSPEVMANYSGVLAAGDLDTTFDGDGKVLIDGYYSYNNTMALQTDGKILFADSAGLLRYNSNGSLDTTFDGDGKVTIDSILIDMALQPDGKIILTSRMSDNIANPMSQSLGFLRYNSNGSLDTSFGVNGKVITNLDATYDGMMGTDYGIRDMVLQADGKILVAGKYQNDFVVARFNSNGTPDTSFSGDGKLTTDFNLGYDGANSIAVQPDGKIVVVGSTNNPNGYQLAVARYDINGTLDPTFSGDGKFTSNLYSLSSSDIALQSDGKILILANFGVARLNSNGSLDTSFDGDGISSVPVPTGSMVLQPNGKIVLVGESNNDFEIARLNSNGSLDTTFSGDGKLTTDFANSYDSATNVALQTDGKIIVAGNAYNSVANYLAIARYKGDGISGTANNDVFIGTANPDDYNGLGGNDLILGFAGNDGLNGGDGNDSLDGGLGADQLQGEAGDDIYTVDNAGDIVTEQASQGRDLVQSSITYTLPVNVEDLTLTGSSAINGTGNTLNNTITGNNANNTLNGSTGADLLVGNAGNDTYIVENVNDVVAEALSEGTDLVQSSITYILPVNVENLTLTGTTAINGTGNALVNTVIGNTANNILNGSTGADQLTGGTGNDTYVVDNAGDIVTELASGGTDLIQSSVTYTLPVEVENLTLTGSSAINGTGNTLVNTLIGNTANNTLNGSTGADQLKGSTGNDTYVVDNAGDIVTELASGGTDLIQSSVTYTLPVEVENLTLTGSSAINGTGNTLVNTLIGNTANNTLNGSTGADQLKGSTGNDTYVVDNAGDIVTELASGGTDLIQSSVTYTLPVEVENLTLTGSSAINGTGNTLVNIITGNTANNTLNGSTGADQLKGSTGNDTYVVDNAGDVVTELASGGTDLVQSSVTYTLPVEVENLTLTGTTAINGTGNALANIITGNTANNILNGSTGNDNLIGSSGADQLLGGDGNDSLSGDAANDTLTGGLGADKFIYNTNAAFTTTAVGVDSITDFTIAQGDLIVLDKTTFTSISSIAGTGFSVATEFAKVTTDALAATSAADIVYNTATGGLFYNQNGTAAGFGTGAQFLTLTTKPVLTATQFVIQA